MLYPHWAFVKKESLGRPVSWGFCEHPPLPHSTSVWGAAAPPQAGASDPLQEAQSISGFVHNVPNTAAADTSHQEDQMALGRLEPNPAPSTQPRPQRLLTSHGSCLVPVQLAPTPASLSFENLLGKF